MTAAATVAVRSEFGPFDLLADWAYESYALGESAAALAACRDALLVVEPAGDRRTAAFLRYVACLAHEHDASWSLLRTSAEELLATLTPQDGPYWRAKALAGHSLALLHQGRVSTALDALAEAYALVLDHPGTAYNRAAACQALSGPLERALLFAPAARVLTWSADTFADRPVGRASALVVRSELEGVWGLFLELVGRHREADRAYVACASSALHALRVLRAVPPPDPSSSSSDATSLRILQQQADATLEFAYQRLRSEGVDEALLQRYVDGEPHADLLARMALASAAARAGRLDEARRATEVARDGARRLGAQVVAWVATAWLAELHEHQQGSTPATGRWRGLAVGSLERLHADREGRFEHVLAQDRLRKLSDQAVVEDGRLWEDALTGVGNRRMLETLLADGASEQRPTVFVDVDHFKVVNDRFGHEVGDQVLRQVAEVLRATRRVGDLVARYGGDEFVVVLADGGDAAGLARRVRTAVAAHDWAGLAPGLTVSVSAGAADAGPAALHRADRALLLAKAGRR